ncbi:hypothetical protein TMPK1_30960 [Rhodospirillales bacterium TMPK1]|uniref:Uncharacterized protein n=1 Tax=Roseiterribacter gracilis TaxID=2812848 RepID=A0A8S8XG02_9PROT|nr:hypothetical protein TMPK1_30960 [Rhodospirillales bacterium TMPK1]
MARFAFAQRGGRTRLFDHRPGSFGDVFGERDFRIGPFPWFGVVQKESTAQPSILDQRHDQKGARTDLARLVLARAARVAVDIVNRDGLTGAQLFGRGRPQQAARSQFPRKRRQAPIGPVALNHGAIGVGVDLVIADARNAEMAADQFARCVENRVRIGQAAQPVVEAQQKSLPCRQRRFGPLQRAFSADIANQNIDADDGAARIAPRQIFGAYRARAGRIGQRRFETDFGAGPRLGQAGTNKFERVARHHRVHRTPDQRLAIDAEPRRVGAIDEAIAQVGVEIRNQRRDCVGEHRDFVGRGGEASVHRRQSTYKAMRSAIPLTNSTLPGGGNWIVMVVPRPSSLAIDKVP